MGIETPFGTAPGGPDRDCNDFRRLRHARERHVGFPVGRYLQPPPLLFTRDAAVFRPQLWTAVDDPGHFCDAIWRDPGILKFVPLDHMEGMTY